MSESDPPAESSRTTRLRSRRRGVTNRLLLVAGTTMGVTAVVFAFAAAGHPSSVTRTAGTETTTEIERVAAAAATEAVASETTAGAAAGSAASAAAGTTSVAISNYAFSPATITVPVGTTLKWTNEDSVDHTVTTTSGPVSFSSAQLADGQTYSHTFTVAGTYKYYCEDHPNMTATVVVTSATTPPTTAPTTTATSTTGAPGGPTTTTSAPATTTGTMTMTATATGSCASVESSLVMLINHIETVHLEEPLTQQITDILNLNQYVLAHETLVANMLVPVLEAATNGTDASLNMFIEHVKTVHLEEPLTQQIADILNLDQYVAAHTTLIVNMLQPYTSLLTGSC